MRGVVVIRREEVISALLTKTEDPVRLQRFLRLPHFTTMVVKNFAALTSGAKLLKPN